jgi:hypothetical protein
MSKPSHGKLQLDTDNNWVFCPGNTTDLSQGIKLFDLSSSFQTLLDTGQIFCGHAEFHRVYNARAQIQLQDCVLRHVSAHGLTSLVAPSYLKAHVTMASMDKTIWDSAYDEEFDGLSSLLTWEILSKSQFKQLNKNIKPLPSMAIATIKYDEHNGPKCAKYRIVVLGNLDYHQWSRESTSAPVMSQLELCLLTTLAVHNHHVLKNGDIKQAFVQSSIPDNETFIVQPPAGCPHSPPGTYWHLLRSLYGLQCAPKLWFEKISSHFCSIGLQNCEISPCLFYGTLIDGLPPIYVGIYVNDMIYFSADDAVER